MDFKTLKEQTAKDCEKIAEMLKELAAKVREGDTDAFLAFFVEGGTEDGDAKIFAVRETIVLRYFHRRKELGEDSNEESQAEKV